MAKVYIETISSSLYSRTLWDETGGTNYVVGDRVSLADSFFSHAGGSIDDWLYRVYVCIADNNSSIHPFNDPTNWVVAGSSEEYPQYAVDGSICTNSMSNEVYLEHNSTRYSGKGSNRFTWNQATAQGTEHGEIIFADGQYQDSDTGFTIEKLSFTAKNKGKVSISTRGLGNGAIFKTEGAVTQSEKDILEVSVMTGIKFVIGGTEVFHSNHILLSFQSCIITDFGNPFGQSYSPGNFRLGNAESHINIQNTIFDLPNSEIRLIGYQPRHHRGQISQIKSCTFYMAYAAQYTPINYQSDAEIEIINNIFGITTHGFSTSESVKLGADGNEASKGNIIHCYDDGVPPALGDGSCTALNPQFISPESNDFRLRPSSPLIGGISENSNRDEIYVTPRSKTGELPSALGSILVTFNSVLTGSNCLAGIRMPNNGEIYECINTHTLDTSQDFATDTTNWRLVLGTIDDPYGSNEFEGDDTIINKLTSNHDLILLDGDYVYFPITSDSSYPTTSPTLKALNKHKAIIFGGFRPAGFLTKNLVFQNSLAVNGYSDYPLNGRVGFHLENCVIHGAGYWWPPLNCVVKNCLIFHNLNSDRGMFYASFGQATSPLPTDKAIIFTNNTVIFTGSLDQAADGVLSSLINQGNRNATFKKNIFYVKSSFNAGPSTNFSYSEFNNSKLISEDNIVFDENGILVDTVTKGMTYIDPKLVDSDASDHSSYRLRPDSPLIGGVSKSKYSANSVWIDSTSGTGTGTEDDPFGSDQFNDAIDLAITNETFELIHKDGTYTWTTAGEELRHPNLGLVTLVAENFQKATITNYPGRLNIGNLTSQTLKMKDMALFVQDHFIANANCHLIFDNCYVNSSTYLYPSTDGSFNFKNCTFEKRLGSSSHVISTAPGLFVNCLFIDRNLNNDYRFDDTASGRTFKNCIFRSERTSNPNSAIHGNGNLINCAFYNFNSNGYNDEEVIFNGDPLMINFDPISHENSNYALRPTSPLIGQGR